MRETLERHGLGVWAIGNHLFGQAVCDPIDGARHQAIFPPAVWRDGDLEGAYGGEPPSGCRTPDAPPRGRA